MRRFSRLRRLAETDPHPETTRIPLNQISKKIRNWGPLDGGAMAQIRGAVCPLGHAGRFGDFADVWIDLKK
ncbi:hypothetical protein ACQUJS_01545 [Ralstonia pseudosolanacearum]